MSSKVSLITVMLCALAASAIPALGDDFKIDKAELLAQRVSEVLPRSMERYGIELWLVFSRENSLEPVKTAFGIPGTTARGAYLFSLKNGAFRAVAIGADYDVEGMKHWGHFDEVITYGKEGVKPHLQKIVTELDPKVIALDYSRDVTIADGLSHGMRLYLEEALGEGMAKRFVSAEALIVSALGAKLPAEIAALRKAAEVTQQAMAETLSADFIRPGVTTESDVSEHFAKRVKNLGYDFVFCSVVVGPARIHSAPGDTPIRKGDLIRVDCGAGVAGYCADIQRTAYALRDGEEAAPAEIQRFWDVCFEANRAGFRAMRPGARGVDVDTAARGVITAAGLDEYPYGSGHAIGLRVHDVGPYLCPDWPERYGTAVFFELEPNQVFALEPALFADYEPMGGRIHIGIEEDVLITESGAEFLGTTQDELILIRCK